MKDKKRAEKTITNKQKPELKIEPKLDRNLYSVIISIVALAFVLSNSLFPIRCNDVFWHLKTGEEMVKSKSLMRKDVFTFTIYGKKWVEHAWLADILFYLAYLIKGYASLIIFRALIIITMYAILLRLAYELRINMGVAVLLLFPVIFICEGRFITRPHLFSYLLEAVYSYIFMRFILYGKGNVLVLPALMIPWANLHAGFIQGILYLIAFIGGETVQILFKEMTTDRYIFKSKEWNLIKRLSLIVLLTVLASLINPAPLETIYLPFEKEQKELIMKNTTEWFSPFNPFFKGSNFFFYYKIWLVICILSFVINSKKFRLGFFLMAMFAFAQSLMSHRFRVDWAILSYPVVVHNLAYFCQFLKERYLFSKKRLFLGYGLLNLVILLLIVKHLPETQIGFGLEDRFPEAALQFLDKNSIQGNMYNDLSFGGYIIWRAYPYRKVFIDGRNFDADLYQEYLDVQFNEENLDRIINKYNLTIFFLRWPLARKEGIEVLSIMLTKKEDWELVFWDKTAFVYLKKIPEYAEVIQRYAYRYFHPLFFKPEEVDEKVLPFAIKEIERSINEAPNAAKAYQYLGRVHLRLNNLEEAMKAFEQAVALEPKDVQNYNNIGLVYSRLGEHQKAIEYFKKAAKLDPKAGLFYNVSLAYQANNDLDNAILWCLKALNENPQFDKAYASLVYLYSKKGWKEKAKKMAMKFVSISPQNAQAHYILGNIYRDENNLSLAKESYRKAILYDPDFYQAYGNLGAIYLIEGNKIAAAQAFKEVLKINPNDPLARMELQKLEDLNAQ